MSGHELSQLQDFLANNWRAYGPGSVYQYLERQNATVLLELAMANIGKRANELQTDA